jgi:hypothetical protein
MLAAMLQVFRAPVGVPPNTVRTRSSRLRVPLMVHISLVLFALTFIAPTTRTQSMQWLELVPLFDARAFGTAASQPPTGGLQCAPFESFVVPAGKTCTRLWYAVAGQRCFNRYTTNPTVGAPANPASMMLAVFPHNATANIPDVTSAPFKWYNFSQPNGTWANMTDENAAGFGCTHVTNTDWYDVDLTLAPGGRLAAGRYWVTLQSLYADNTSIYGYNFGGYPGNGYIMRRGPNVYAPATPGVMIGGGYAQPPIFPGNTPIKWTTTCQGYGGGQVSNFDIAYAVYAYCTANASDPLLSPIQVPPATCSLKAGDTCLGTGCLPWTCPGPDFVLNSATAAAPGGSPPAGTPAGTSVGTLPTPPSALQCYTGSTAVGTTSPCVGAPRPQTCTAVQNICYATTCNSPSCGGPGLTNYGCATGPCPANSSGSTWSCCATGLCNVPCTGNSAAHVAAASSLLLAAALALF